MNTFDQATAVDRGGRGGYTARLDPAWDGPFAPNGGVIAAILLRAAQAELGWPDLPPRTLTVHYLRPAAHDPAQLSVRVLRAGRHNATVQVGFHQRDKLGCTALITFPPPGHTPWRSRRQRPTRPGPSRSKSSARRRSRAPRPPSTASAYDPASARRPSPAPPKRSPAAGSACAMTAKPSFTKPSASSRSPISGGRRSSPPREPSPRSRRSS